MSSATKRACITLSLSGGRILSVPSSPWQPCGLRGHRAEFQPEAHAGRAEFHYGLLAASPRPEERRWSIARHLEITQQRIGDVVVVSLDGWLVADEHDIRFRDHIDAIASDGIANIVVDLHDVTLLDSGGIGVLVAKLLTLRQRGGDLRLARLSDRTRRVLSITHLLTVFAAFDSPEDAVHSFTSHPPDAARVDEPSLGDETTRRDQK